MPDDFTLFVKLYWVQINSTNIHLNMQLKSAVLKQTRHKLDKKSMPLDPLPNIVLLIKVTVHTCQGESAAMTLG